MIFIGRRHTEPIQTLVGHCHYKGANSNTIVLVFVVNIVKTMAGKN